jgi:hypothetical protein
MDQHVSAQHQIRALCPKGKLIDGGLNELNSGQIGWLNLSRSTLERIKSNIDSNRVAGKSSI